jgi:hypothetical protein
MARTRAPFWARDTARLARVVVLPSPGLELLITTTRPRFAGVAKIKFVRTTR